MFIGYSFGKKTLKVYYLDSHYIMISHDVLFHENELPYKHMFIPNGNLMPIIPIPLDLTAYKEMPPN